MCHAPYIYKKLPESLKYQTTKKKKEKNRFFNLTPSLKIN